MEVPVALDSRSITTPHKDLDYLPLADKDFQIKDLTFDETSLKLHCRYRDNYLNHVDNIGLWESNLPKYQFQSVHVFLEIIHYCHANCDPVLNVVMSPDQKILFIIIAESINEILQLHLGQDLTPCPSPISLKDSPNCLVPEVLKSSRTSFLKKNTCQRIPLLTCQPSFLI